ncbi:hypothetical protein DKG74_02640 [Zavarzinia aquatilis]|uniref:Uncharacterized protein n=1 Tax=Zavarzinia aquatilis TaxID=2211142 RepID=A0A317EFN7_9PROT|nr:hypothetical protein DKG74_02640 [Zavarzinia aquatilis]
MQEFGSAGSPAVEPAAFDRIAFIGAGARGTALALTAHRAGRHVSLSARDAPPLHTVAATRRTPVLIRLAGCGLLSA